MTAGVRQTEVVREATFGAATLPTPRGPLSSAVIEALATAEPVASAPVLDEVDPYGDDLQLALKVSYELHYRGFHEVAADREWDVGLIAFREALDAHFIAAIRRDAQRLGRSDGAVAEMAELTIDPADGEGVSYHLRDEGTWRNYLDYFALRSIYHLKEADPHAWTIPRLRPRSKAGFVAVEFDEFGGGRASAVHQQLYADLLAAAGLRNDYLGYLDSAPAAALATVNFMSSIGLHRSLRGAAIGHFAATEITSSPGSRRILEGLERLDAPEACRHFYREHAIADAVHEQVMRSDVVGGLLAEEPELEDDVVLGVRGFLITEDALADHLLSAWQAGRDAVQFPER